MKGKSISVMLILRHFILLLFSLVVAYPVFWMIMISFKSKYDFYNSPLGIPKKILWENYTFAYAKMNMGRSYLNTLIIVAVSLFMIVFLSLFAGYAIGRIKFKTSSFLFVMFISTMSVPIQIRLLPIYVLERNMHIIDTLWGLILPYICGGLPFSIFIFVGFLKSIPRDIDDAAIIDGCSRLETVLRMLLPLSKPGIASVIIFQFMNIWNDMFLPLVIIQDPKLRTLTLGLLKFKEQYQRTDFIKMFSALVMINIPIIIVYIIFQRQFISGLTSGSVKS